MEPGCSGVSRRGAENAESRCGCVLSLSDLSARVDGLAALVEAQSNAIHASLLKWIVVLWATTILAIIGLR